MADDQGRLDDPAALRADGRPGPVVRTGRHATSEDVAAALDEE